MCLIKIFSCLVLSQGYYDDEDDEIDFTQFWLPLHFIIRFFGNCVNSVRILLEADPFMILERCDGWSPLHLAVRYFPNETELIDMLLRCFPGSVVERLNSQYDVIRLYEHGGGNNPKVLSMLRRELAYSKMSNEQYCSLHSSQVLKSKTMSNGSAVTTTSATSESEMESTRCRQKEKRSSISSRVRNAFSGKLHRGTRISNDANHNNNATADSYLIREVNVGRAIRTHQ